MAFAIRRPFFSFAIESYICETDFTLGLSQKYQISLLSPLLIGSNIDILWQLRPLTANYQAMYIVTSTTLYTL